jgi:sporulation protein YlmC with PRC-barrel domain
MIILSHSDSSSASDMFASELGGKEVFAAGMKSVGTVKDLIIDPQGYVLTDLVVKMQKDASRRIFGKRFTLRGAKVRVPMSTVEKMGESILLKYDVDQLEQHVQQL